MDHWRNQRGNLKIPSIKWQQRYDLWDAAKAVLRGKFIAIQAHLRANFTSKGANFTSKGARERRADKT